jgi:hypothetical protein
MSAAQSTAPDRADRGPRNRTANSHDSSNPVGRYDRFRRRWELERLRRLPMHYGLACYCRRWSA